MHHWNGSQFLLVVCLSFASLATTGCGNSGLSPMVMHPEQKALYAPDHSWPNEEQVQALYRLKGRSAAEVLRVMGKPVLVETLNDGTECWKYPWQAACCVWIKDEECTAVFYTAGY